MNPACVFCNPRAARLSALVLLTFTILLATLGSSLCGADSGPLAPPPQRVQAERFNPVAMPHGAIWGCSVKALAEGRLAITAVASTDNGRTWGPRRTLVELPRVKPPETVWGDVVPLVDRKTGDFHAFILKWDQTDKKRPFPKLGLWHLQSAPPYERWTEPAQLFDGYIGGLLSAVQHSSGTIISPFAYMTTHSYSEQAAGLGGWIFRGQHTATAVFSTDRGTHFQRSNEINIPASILLGNENGAIEPVCLPLKNGRVWMLFRTQLGRLWESFSPDGARWSEPRPSRFISSDSPASLTCLSDGRIVAIWNCCQRYPYAFGGRQVLHAAISADDGRTWDGFREVLRDPHRLAPALPIRGDYGTAYPVAAPTRDGKLVFATGQGATNGVFLLDPAWLTAAEQRDDFANGLEAWSVYGTKGVTLVPRAGHESARVLKLERTDAEFPAGAVWNFPNGRAGTLRIRFRLLPGPAATAITLTDHFSSPFDREAELNGLFTISLSADASLKDGVRIGNDRSHELDLSWDFRDHACRARVDGIEWKVVPQLRVISEGANYLRFRVLSDHPTAGGILIESVEARVDQNVAAESSGVPR
jgi:hypothetical protein